MKEFIFWLPRILTILFIVFLSMFALDAFDGDSLWYEKLIGFFIHLIPSFALIVILILAWKKYLIGSLLFIALGIFYIILFPRNDIISILIISGPTFLIGLLFLIDKYLNKK